MKPLDYFKDNFEFPEAEDWNLHDKITVCNVAQDICEQIKADLQTEKRHYTPGLRLALNIINYLYPLKENHADLS